MTTTQAIAPKPGDAVRVTLRSGEEIVGNIEWIDNNGAWVKGEKRSRWIPIEIIVNPQPPPSKAKNAAREDPLSLTNQSRLERQPIKKESSAPDEG